jgi:hypothetical protein
MHGDVGVDDSVEPVIELGEGFSDSDRITLSLTTDPHPGWANIFDEQAAALFSQPTLEQPVLRGEKLDLYATAGNLQKSLDGLLIVLRETNQIWAPIGQELRDRNAAIQTAVRETLGRPDATA